MKRDFRPPRPVRSRPAKRQRVVSATVPRGRFFTALVSFGKWLSLVLTAIVLMLVAIATVGYLWLTGQDRLSTEESLLILPNQLENTDQPAYWLSFSPATQSIRIVKISPQIEQTLPAGYGSYQVGKIAPLLAIDQRSSAEVRTIATYTFGRLLTRPLLPAASNQLETRRELEQYLWQQMTQPTSQLSRQEAFVLWSFVRDVPDLNTQFLAVSTAAELERQLGQLGSMLPDKNCTIAVINSTGTAGVAGRVGKLIERSGGVVINLNDTPVTQAQSQILMGEAGACAATAQLLLPLVPEGTVVVTNSSMVAQYRSEIVIQLGTDSLRLF